MYNKAKNTAPKGPSASVLAVAFAQLLVGLAFSAIGAFIALGTSAQYRANRAAGFTAQYPSSGSFGFFFGVLPLCLGLLSVVTAIGLVRRRDWARRATIFLATVPVLICALVVLLCPAAMFPPPLTPPSGSMLALGSGLVYGILRLLLIVLAPAGAWWLVVSTRAEVRSQFRGDTFAVGQEELLSRYWFWACLAIGALFVLAAFIASLRNLPWE
jgi:hypothetical protein